jgi:hypothetical protein
MATLLPDDDSKAKLLIAFEMLDVAQEVCRGEYSLQMSHD